MRSPKLLPRKFLWLTAVTFALGCNALLENDPRSLEEDSSRGSEDSDSATGGAAGDGTSGGSSGSGGDATAGSAGASGSVTGGSGGQSGNGSAGEAGSEGDSAAGNAGSSAGNAGSAGSNVVDAGISDASLDADAADRVAVDARADASADAARDALADADAEAEAAPPDPCSLPTRACTAGDKGSEQMACDSCGTGKATRTRTCDSKCAWGAWSAYGACVSTEECTKGATETKSVACPCGSTKGQSRTCSSSCKWGGWTDTSKCSVGCCGQLIYCDTPDNLEGIPASRGTWCKQTSSACSHAQVDEDCRNILEDVSCTLQQVYYIDYL